MFDLVQVLLTLPVKWDALRESGLANTVYKGGVLSHPNRGVKTLAESLCKQWSNAAPNKKPRCACMQLKALKKCFYFSFKGRLLRCKTSLHSGDSSGMKKRARLMITVPSPATAEPERRAAECSMNWLHCHCSIGTHTHSCALQLSL